MSGDQAHPQPLGVIWHMARQDAPAAGAVAVPARFGQVGPEAEAELARAMGQDASSLVRRRIEAGRRSYAAWADGHLATYGWVSFGEELVGELGLHLRLLPHEAYIWDCLTLAAYRRRGLYTALLGYIVQALLGDGVQGIWIGADTDNQPSQAGIAHTGFTAVADLVAAPPQPGERRRRAWLQARPGASQTLLSEARRAYLNEHDEVWLFANEA